MLVILDERRLHPSEFPLQIQLEWPNNEHFAFQLRRNVEGVQRRVREKNPVQIFYQSQFSKHKFMLCLFDNS